MSFPARLVLAMETMRANAMDIGHDNESGDKCFRGRKRLFSISQSRHVTRYGIFCHRIIAIDADHSLEQANQLIIPVSHRSGESDALRGSRASRRGLAP